MAKAALYATRHSVCPHDCPSVCALDVDLVAPDRVGRLRGAPQPYTDGVICAKVARYEERIHHPDRLMTPLKRTGAKGEGQFAPISWDEALETVATAFRTAAERHGPETVWPYYYAGTMGLIQRDGIERLRHVMGYSRQHTTICVGTSRIGWSAAVGKGTGTDPREMAQSDVIVIWGANAVHTQVHVMNWVQKAKKTRGAKLVVVDPYRTATAEKADLHLMPMPGTDAALACAIMHILFRDGHADRDWMARHTDVPEDLEAHLSDRTPEWAAAITGIPAEQIEAFAALYGSTKRSFIRVGYGFTRNRLGAVSMHAVACLPSVTGAWAHEGGGAQYSLSADISLDKTLAQGTDRLDPSVRLLDMSRIGPVLTGDPQDLGNGPPVTAMLVQNTNPAAVAPHTQLVRQGLAREDLFLCVHEQFMTETAKYADIVLPATMFLEHDDIYVAGGHPFLQGHRAVMPAAGECRSNHDVLCALAERLGADHPGFRMSAWDHVDHMARSAGLPDGDALIEQRWVFRGRTGDAARFRDGFPHKDGRFHFAPNWANYGPDHACLPTLPDFIPLIEMPDAEHPYRLVAAPARNFLNTTFSETPTSRRMERQPTALIHPDTCAALDLTDGGRVQIGNRRGTVSVAVRAFDGLQPRTVVVEGIWPNGDFAGGNGINTLVSADPAPPNGGAVFHDTAVWLRPEASPVPGSEDPAARISTGQDASR